MGQGCLAEYLTRCPTSSHMCLAFSDSIQLGNQVGSSPGNPQHCPWLSPSQPRETRGARTHMGRVCWVLLATPAPLDSASCQKGTQELTYYFRRYRRTWAL